MALVAPHSLPAADAAWLMTATTLVLLMTLPGVALFYAGMVRRKNVLNTMASVLGVAAVVSLVWFALTYSLAFGVGSPWLGDLSRAWFSGLSYLHEAQLVAASPVAPHLPESVYAMFQLSFAIITVALVVGAFVERMRFSAVLWFAALWCVIVYAPVAHWVWAPNGWLAQMGALDFAGGAVVHVNAGVAGLVCAFVLGARKGYGREPFEPYSLGFTMIGACLLWVGWFGFNAGSALAADGRAGLAMVATHLAASGGALGWLIAEWTVRRRPSLLGLCSGVVAGLVAVTPAAGYVRPGSAALMGLLAGVACYWGATALKRWLKADDSLDVFGVHGVGGIVGSVLTGLMADPRIGGVSGHVGMQTLAVAAVALYSAAGTLLVLGLVRVLVGLRVDPDAEHVGLDLAEHRERQSH